ncbi:MAG TPA: urate hydroxylase PuuD [Steroidobacteraceae bacterium]|nr:urate hydroxylase PuuD [Steroidobacteraceae bacterium]
MHPINSVRGAITTGVVLAVIIGILLTVWAGQSVTFHLVRADRWLHILAGVMWIGLLYYFNVVQTPGLAAAAADKGGPGGAGISKYIAPRALLWFRWAAVVTWLSGAAYLMGGYGRDSALGAIGKAFLLESGYRTIGTGAWLGTIMLFNVWVFIWPNQKKILGIVPATDDEKAAARKTAGMASRINFILSIPMLMCMGGQSHLLPF